MTDPQWSFQNGSKGRYYRHPSNSRIAPSITNIKKVKHIPLGGVAARACAEYAADRRAELAALDRDEVYTLVKDQAYKPNPAAAIGDVVHTWIDSFESGRSEQDAYEGGLEAWRELAPKDRTTAGNMWKAYLGWYREYNERYGIETVDTEYTVWNDDVGYAGTADSMFSLGSLLVLRDNKTGKSAYPDVAMQLAALHYAPVRFDHEGSEHQNYAAERFAVLHVRPTYARLLPVEHIGEWFEAFKGLKAVFDTDQQYSATTLIDAPKVEWRKLAKEAS